MIRNSEDYFRYYVKSTSIGLSLTYAGFTLSAGFSRTRGEIESLLRNNTRVMSTLNNEALMFKLAILSPYTPELIHPRFTQAVNNLPAEYDANAYKSVHLARNPLSPVSSNPIFVRVLLFRRFLSAWGTHYFTNAQYGAKVNFTTAFDSDLTIRRGSEWTQKQMSLSVGYAMFSVGVASALATAENNVETSFTQSSTTVKDVTGGSPTVLERDGWNAWVNDAKTQPGLIVGRSLLAPITDLIFDAAKKQHLGTALVAYCNENQE